MKRTHQSVIKGLQKLYFFEDALECVENVQKISDEIVKKIENRKRKSIIWRFGGGIEVKNVFFKKQNQNQLKKFRKERLNPPPTNIPSDDQLTLHPLMALIFLNILL